MILHSVQPKMTKLLHSQRKSMRFLTLSCAFAGLFAGVVESIQPAFADIFSTPDAQQAPSFVQKKPNQQAPRFGNMEQLPDRNSLRAIPSMTPQQLKQVDQITFQHGDQVQALRGELDSLNRILAEHKKANLPSPVFAAMGDEMMANNANQFGNAGGYLSQSDDAIKIRMDSVKQQLAQADQNMYQGYFSLLSSSQVNELREMERGTLQIRSARPTDLPPPVVAQPMARPPMMAGRPAPGAFNPYTPVHYPQSTSGVVLHTTKQLLYRTLWSLR